MTMTRIMGDSVRNWFKGLFRWRVAPRWYLFAVGVPLTLAVVVTAEFAMFGEKLDWSILDNRVAAFLPSLLIIALVSGGNEEPGWRGFALPARSGSLRTRTVNAAARRALGAVAPAPPVRHG